MFVSRRVVGFDSLRHLQIRVLDLWEDRAHWVPMLLEQATHLTLETLTLHIWLHHTSQLQCNSARNIYRSLTRLVRSSPLSSVTVVYRGTMPFSLVKPAIMSTFSFCERDCELKVIEGDYFYHKSSASN